MILRRLEIVWHVLTGKFIVGYIQMGDRASSFAIGGVSGSDVVLASVSLCQQASRLKDIHTDSMVNKGFARSVGRLTKDWNMWLEVALKQPYISPADFVDLNKEEGDA